MRYRADIDGLRAIAVLAVVLFHFRIWPASGGFVGVDVFFVISGFLITSIIFEEIRGGRFSYAAFYERRIRRLFPALFAVLAASSVAAWCLLFPGELASFGKALASAAAFFANFFYFRSSGYFDAPAEMKPLLHTWSLAVEEQFYIAFPPLLLLANRLFKRRLLLVVALFAFASFLASVYVVLRRPSAAFYLPMFRAWELALGALLVIGRPPELPSRVRDVSGMLGLAAILYASVAYSEATTFPGLSALVPCLGAALLLDAGAHGPTWASRILAWRPLAFVGLVSYSFYLWHWPMLVFAKQYLTHAPTGSEKVALIVASFVASVLSWRFVERPFRGREGLFNRQRLFAVATAAIGALILLGVVGWRRSGFPARFPERVLAVMKTTSEPRRFEECTSTSASCRLGLGESSPTFLVWGDSHALALAPAFDELARQRSQSGRFVWRSACPPLLGVERYDRGKQGCPRFNDSVLALLDASPELRTVVLVGRWAVSCEGWLYGEEAGPPAIISPKGVAGNREVFAAGLERTLSALKERGKEVVFVAQVPEVGWIVPSVLARSLWFGREPPPGPSLDAYRARQRTVSEIVSRLRSRFSFQVVDASAALCTAGRPCSIGDDDGPYYRDGHHLSRRGALRFVPSLSALIP